MRECTLSCRQGPFVFAQQGYATLYQRCWLKKPANLNHSSENVLSLYSGGPGRIWRYSIASDGAIRNISLSVAIFCALLQHYRRAFVLSTSSLSALPDLNARLLVLTFRHRMFPRNSSSRSFRRVTWRTQKALEDTSLQHEQLDLGNSSLPCIIRASDLRKIRIQRRCMYA